MIWVDYRERGSGVIRALKKAGTRYEIRALDTGDYIVDGSILIERKTSRDFLVSLKTGRLFNQIGRLKKQGKRQLLIIEGLPLTLIGGASSRAINGALVAIAVSWELPILYSECPAETAAILLRIGKQVIKSLDLKPRKTYWRKKSSRPVVQKKKVLESMPMIGPYLAEELLAEFGSLEKIFNASPDELAKTRGIGKGKASKIKDILKEQKVQYKYNSVYFEEGN